MIVSAVELVIMGPYVFSGEYSRFDTCYWLTKDPCVMIVSAVELVIMGPLCILR